MESLVTITTQVPGETPEPAVAGVHAREPARSRGRVARGHLLRLWRPPPWPGEWRTLGLFAADGAQLQHVLASMPLRVWRTDEITPLSPHSHDPMPPAALGPPVFLATFTTADRAPERPGPVTS